jgi:hypothetical protein
MNPDTQMIAATLAALNQPVGLFRVVTDHIPFETPLLSQVLSRIQHGTYRKEIAHARRVLSEQSEEAYKKTKTHLVSMTPACRGGQLLLVGIWDLQTESTPTEMAQYGEGLR